MKRKQRAWQGWIVALALLPRGTFAQQGINITPATVQRLFIALRKSIC